MQVVTGDVISRKQRLFKASLKAMDVNMANRAIEGCLFDYELRIVIQPLILTENSKKSYLKFSVVREATPTMLRITARCKQAA